MLRERALGAHERSTLCHQYATFPDLNNYLPRGRCTCLQEAALQLEAARREGSGWVKLDRELMARVEAAQKKVHAELEKAVRFFTFLFLYCGGVESGTLYAAPSHRMAKHALSHEAQSQTAISSTLSDISFSPCYRLQADITNALGVWSVAQAFAHLSILTLRIEPNVDVASTTSTAIIRYVPAASQYKENETLYFQRVPPLDSLPLPAAASLVAAMPPPPDLEFVQDKWIDYLTGVRPVPCAFVLGLLRSRERGP